jgi:hypothetical protein
VLAATWLWIGVVFFGRHAAELDPALSAAYGALFVVWKRQALLAPPRRSDLAPPASLFVAA